MRYWIITNVIQDEKDLYVTKHVTLVNFNTFQHKRSPISFAHIAHFNMMYFILIESILATFHLLASVIIIKYNGVMVYPSVQAVVSLARVKIINELFTATTTNHVMWNDLKYVLHIVNAEWNVAFKVYLCYKKCRQNELNEDGVIIPE